MKGGMGRKNVSGCLCGVLFGILFGAMLVPMLSPCVSAAGPTVDITTPATGLSIRGTYNVYSNITFAGALQWVELKVDGVAVSHIDTPAGGSPYQ